MTILNQIRPIDKKFQIQIDRLLKSGADKSNKSQKELENETSLHHRPNPDLLVPKDVNRIYRPPMITPTSMDHDNSTSNKDEQISRETKRRISKSDFIKQMANDLEGRKA